LFKILVVAYAEIVVRVLQALKGYLDIIEVIKSMLGQQVMLFGNMVNYINEFIAGHYARDH
jgi:hypothetical protein